MLNILIALLFAQNIAFAEYVPTSVAIYSEYYKQDPLIIMDIISCEGGFNEVRRSKTSDIGPMQINQVHIATAKKMNLDLSIHDDNIHYGIYLMSKEGLRPWKSSKSCWSKHPVSGSLDP